MSGIVHIINVNTTDCSNKKNYYNLGDKKYVNPLANPFSYNGKRTSIKKLSFKTNEEAIEAYKAYFETVYGQPGYEELTREFNNIYKHYKNGEDIYLGEFSSVKPCVSDVIKEQLQKKLIREKIAEAKIKRMGCPA